MRYTYRYSTTITTALRGSTTGRNGLALDCVVDIDVVSRCHLMMQIRNSQIKQRSPEKEHSVHRVKILRESLERTRLKFSLQGGKVTALCIQKGEQVWALNIKRAVLSMLQTSQTAASGRELEEETDVYGTCTSSYERRGSVMLKIRNLKQCHKHRLANFWPHAVPLSEDTSLQSELHCIQQHGSTVMEGVNCTETVSMATWSRYAGLVKTQTVATLVLLRIQPGTPPGVDSLSRGVLTDLQFDDDGVSWAGKERTSTPQRASQTVRSLCGLTSESQQFDTYAVCAACEQLMQNGDEYVGRQSLIEVEEIS
ncbi:apolipophorins-like [Thalassophryne amazonica]|uniref:apolipophorins-like n=1 Tax=Thalassophryne amazonica TaxID=390379 RepID=UPI001470AEB0|nr:apolipophorins-like [Thalassophryne amazonica]